MSQSIKLSKEKKEHMVKVIKTYFNNERNEELGDLGAALVLDFFIDKLAPEFYNQGISDSYAYMNDRIEDILGLQIYPSRKK
jgi:uncharacterized protein (DUF2164 family)